MLRRFDSIKNCGNFENFRWDANVPDFERINLIYGSNGAGKTSLANALNSLKKEAGGFSNMSICMSKSDKTQNRTSNESHDDEFERVFVFCDEYVSNNHNFDDNTEVAAVLTLGERTVEEEKRIKELKSLIEENENRLPEAINAERSANRALESEYQTIAQSIVTALSRAGNEYRSNSNYHKGTVKNRFSASHAEWTLLSDDEKKAALAIVNSDERLAVSEKSYSLSPRPHLGQEIKEALSMSPVSVVLDTLKDHLQASSWVETGRHIHKELDQCIFCGGDLTEDRKRQIEQHFSDEVEEVQRIVDALISEVKKLNNSAQTLTGDGVIAGSLFDDFRDTFNAAYPAVESQVGELEKWLKGLLEVLEKKRANVVACIDYAIPDTPEVDGSALEKAVKEHNIRVRKHDQLVESAAKKVELHLLKEAEERITELEEAASNATKAKVDLEAILKKDREEMAALANAEGDPRPSAAVLTREFARIFGRNELLFEPHPDGKHYRITRHGKPAVGLSTGERTAITLIHFLENVKASAASFGPAIVIIDDPVSSLDSGSAMGISTYIWSEAVSKGHIEQVFLLTHNFELFRQWDIQIEGLKGKRGANNKHGFSSQCYELVAKHQEVSGVIKRVPGLKHWPEKEEVRTKIRSSYHHAFITVSDAYLELQSNTSMERKLDALLLYPNVIRRMLETFLAFKHPTSVGNFTNAMREISKSLEALGYNGDADAIRLRLTRFTHAYSHAESPETNIAVTPDEIGPIISAAFIFMNVVDKNHFEGLCKVIEVEPSKLLLEAPSVVGPNILLSKSQMDKSLLVQ